MCRAVLVSCFNFCIYLSCYFCFVFFISLFFISFYGGPKAQVFSPNVNPFCRPTSRPKVGPNGQQPALQPKRSQQPAHHSPNAAASLKTGRAPSQSSSLHGSHVSRPTRHQLHASSHTRLRPHAPGWLTVFLEPHVGYAQPFEQLACTK